MSDLIPSGTSIYRITTEKMGGGVSSTSTTFIGDQGDIFYDPVIGDLRLSDDNTPGGIPLLQAINDAPANANTIPPGSNTTNIVYNFSQMESQGVLNYGNVKQGFQSIDHFGWILLDGRAISTLTPTQQVICAQLNWTGNLPNATGRVAKMSGETTGTIGGSDTYNIQQTNLPQVTLSGTSTVPNYTKVDVIAAVNMDNPDVYGNISGNINASTSVALNPGVFTPFNVVNKYIALNTFVFLGL